MILSRRHLLAGSAATAFSGLRVAFADTTTGATSGNASTAPILVVLFCRFGQDGMQLVAPADDPNYIQNRPNIRVQSSGTDAGLPIGAQDGVNMYFHPALPELQALYNAKQLAVITAAGVPTDDRSHFTVQDTMERGGAEGQPNPSTGWFARHLASIGVASTFGAIAVSSGTPTSLSGDTQALAIPSPQSFNVHGGTAITNVTSKLVSGNTAYEQKAREALGAIATVQSSLATLGSDDTSGYTGGDLSTPLKSLAQLIKMNVGLTAATVDMGGWDHHQNLVPNFQSRAMELSKSIGAFWQDVAAYQNRITLVTMTEFGRRFQENSNKGLDHGSASTMLVLSGTANGGQIYGQWPGLAPNQLYSGDLAVTTDYRQVLAEILVKRHGEQTLANVFPTVTYGPLGIFS